MKKSHRAGRRGAIERHGLKDNREMQIGGEFGGIVMAIRNRDGTMHFNPAADTAVRGGDYLIVMGRQESLRALNPCWQQYNRTLVAESRCSCGSASSSFSNPLPLRA